MSIQDYISSGILEQYVLGTLNKNEALEVERMASTHLEVRKEIQEISIALEKQALDEAVEPSPKIKPFIMATIDYMERMEKGEKQSFPPIITENSKLSEFTEWLNRKDIVLPPDAEDLYAKIISHTPEALTAIVWIKKEAPAEIHQSEYERFLIAEGTCIIKVEEEITHLKPGDFFAIPLFKSHTVIVTSDVPCKVILQRIAA